MIQNALHAFLSLHTLCEGKLREGIPIPPSPLHTHHPRERTIPRSSTGLSRYYYYY